MKIFEAPSVENKKRDWQPLYPERPSEAIDGKIKILADFEAGRIEKISITPEERAEIQKLEDVLGTTLEKIFAITPQEAVFFTEYFLSDEGKKEFEALIGRPLGNDEETPQSVERALYESTALIAGLDAKKRGNFVGHSRDYSEKLLLEQLLATRDSGGRIAIETIDMPVRARLLLTPSENLAKIIALKKFKDTLKHYTETPDVSMTEKSEGFRQILSGILEMYQSRVNAMIVENRIETFSLKRKADVLGKDALAEDEQALFAQAVGMESVDANLSRYDKFSSGATAEYNAVGQRNQVGSELKEFADRFEEEYVTSVVLRSEQIKERGLDPEKIAATTIPAEEVERVAKETLRAYGFLSEHPASEYASDRPGPAPDNKWQFVMRDEFKTFGIDSKRKAIKCGRANQSVAHLISVTLAHEIEGHVLQHENKSKIPLRLFKRLGSGRATIFAECGAMSNQDVVSRDAFGYASPPHPYYVRAMQKKLEGGNYLDCLETFYESSLKAIRLQKELGKIFQEDFEKQCEKSLKLAINRTKRLFQGSPDLASSEPSLANSKDTVYLEQVKLFQELKKHNLEKYVFVGGANLDALVFLMKSGFLNPEDIEKPKNHSLEIWNRMKDNYTLSDQE